MYVVAQQGILPKSMRKVNKNDVPINFVIVQGIIVTAWAALLTFGGGGNNVSFMTAISLTVVTYLVAYLLFFVACVISLITLSDLVASDDGEYTAILVSSIVIVQHWRYSRGVNQQVLRLIRSSTPL